MLVIVFLLYGTTTVATTCNYHSIRIHLQTFGHPLHHSASCVRMRYGRMLNADPGKVSSRAKKWGSQRAKLRRRRAAQWTSINIIQQAPTTFGGYTLYNNGYAWFYPLLAIDVLYPFTGGLCSPNPIHLIPFGHGLNFGSQRIGWGNTTNE